MHLLLDTANIQQIQYYCDILPVTGITTNPSILQKAGEKELWTLLDNIKTAIGDMGQLHVQVTASDAKNMITEARTIRQRLGSVYIKVPVTEEGLKCIKALKAEDISVTATAVYSSMQGLLAAAAGADYIAPYCNRMEWLGTDFSRVISIIRNDGERTGSSTKIVAASFRSPGQVLTAIESGAHAVTLSPSMIKEALSSPAVDSAISSFSKDWSNLFGNSMLHQL